MVRWMFIFLALALVQRCSDLWYCAAATVAQVIFYLFCCH